MLWLSDNFTFPGRSGPVTQWPFGLFTVSTFPETPHRRGWILPLGDEDALIHEVLKPIAAKETVTHLQFGGEPGARTTQPPTIEGSPTGDSSSKPPVRLPFR